MILRLHKKHSVVVQFSYFVLNIAFHRISSWVQMDQHTWCCMLPPSLLRKFVHRLQHPDSHFIPAPVSFARWVSHPLCKVEVGLQQVYVHVISAQMFFWSLFTWSHVCTLYPVFLDMIIMQLKHCVQKQGVPSWAKLLVSVTTWQGPEWRVFDEFGFCLWQQLPCLQCSLFL